MATRLINVRLDEERLRKVRELRQQGVALSELVREAIDQRFEEMTAAKAPRDIKAILAELYAKYPEPPDYVPRNYDVHDAKQARAAIIAHLNRKKK